MLFIAILFSLFAYTYFLPKSLEHYGKTYFNYSRSKDHYFRDNLKYLILTQVVLFLVLGSMSDTNVLALSLLLFVGLGIYIFDTKFKIIPNYFHLIGVIGVSACIYENSTFSEYLIKMIPGGIFVLFIILANIVYEKVTGKDAMGQGDIKMYAWLTLAFGSDIKLVFLLSCFFGLIFNVNKFKSGKTFAFAPYIIFSSILFWTISVKFPIFFRA